MSEPWPGPGPGPTDEIVLVPDDADSQRFVELHSYKADLSEALESIEGALAAGTHDVLWPALTMHAATAYCRPFMPSKVRRRLDEHEDLPDLSPEQRSLHRSIRMFRNRTVAHSHSDLLAVMATAALDEAGTVTNVFASVSHARMPMVIADDFAQLIEDVEERVDAMTHSVWLRLRERWRGTAVEHTSTWRRAIVEAVSDTDFSSARTRRAHAQVVRHLVSDGHADSHRPRACWFDAESIG